MNSKLIVINKYTVQSVGATLVVWINIKRLEVYIEL